MTISSQSKLMRTDAVTEILTTKKKDKILGCKLLKTDPGKKNLDILEIAVKYLDTSNNQLKNPNN